MSLPTFQPMTLTRKAKPFNAADWIFEIKHDGFRSLAYVENHMCRLVSRKGNLFTSVSVLSEWIGQHLNVDNAVLDGEIVCLDIFGRSLFNKLLFRKHEPNFRLCFCAFDLLWLNGKDVRNLSLIDRKGLLETIVPKKPSRVLYMTHVEEDGTRLFELSCQLDLEGIVAKQKDSLYEPSTRKPAWLKIKNRNYSQAEGREEFFRKNKQIDPANHGN
jgi:bifunctional non-homologous end joining protein LigD